MGRVASPRSLTRSIRRWRRRPCCFPAMRPLGSPIASCSPVGSKKRGSLLTGGETPGTLGGSSPPPMYKSEPHHSPRTGGVPRFHAWPSTSVVRIDWPEVPPRSPPVQHHVSVPKPLARKDAYTLQAD